MIDTSRINYDPESQGLELVAELDWAGAYEFDMVCVWRQFDTGQLWAAHDSGCSCPVPFESHTWPTDFTEVRSISDVETLITSNVDYREPSFSEALDLLIKVKAALAVEVTETQFRKRGVIIAKNGGNNGRS